MGRMAQIRSVGRVMSDLIKREEVLKVIHDYFKEFLDYIEEQKNEEEKYSRDIFMVLAENKKLYTKIKEIPVAYEVDKVIEQIHNMLFCYDIPTDLLDEIVKGGGGVNE